MKTITISELMPLVKDAWPHLCDYTIGFVKVIDVSRSNTQQTFEAVLAGSGILVTANGKYAILTADHVLKNLPRTEEIGLVLISSRDPSHHRVLLDMRHVGQITIARGTEEALGPDLALLILPSTSIGVLKSKKSFHNLEKRRTKMLDQAANPKPGPWVMLGLIGEMTQNINPLPGMNGAIAFKGVGGPVVVTHCRQDDAFDYVSAEVNFGKDFDLPDSFGGSSGSGLWRLILSKKDEIWTLDDFCLGGIAFYQSAPHGKHRFIECHGIRSIYDHVVDALAKH